MKRLNIFLIALLLLSIPATAQIVDTPKLKIRAQVAGIFQALENDNNPHSLPKVPIGIQSAMGNLYFDANIVDGIDVNFELYLSSRHHEGEVWAREGYIYLSHLPKESNFLGLNSVLKYVDIKAGHFEVDFGNWHLTRSDNGDVQRNPLVGNVIIDANTVEPGVELIGKHGFFNWVAGVSTGTTTGDFKEGRGLAWHGKAGISAKNAFNFAASVYRVDHSANPTGYPNNGSYSELFAGNRSGGRYAGVVGGGTEPEQIKAGKGQDVTAWQLDGYCNFGNKLHVAGFYGFTKDADINGSDPGKPVNEWIYGSAEAKFDLTSRLYAATRYNFAKANTLKSVASDGKVDQIQIGLGYWIVNNMLFKAEYTRWKCGDFTTPPFQDDPEFSGFVAEVSVAF